MENFIYCTPTKLYFGKDSISNLVNILKPLGKKVLLTYGGGSIKKNGLYDKVKQLLKDFEIFELSGIEPNPKYESVVKGAKICKENNIDVILSVGGGSVLDCSKAISSAALYDGEAWDLITYKVKTTRALPIVDIITLAATGSEYDSGGVISRKETNDKVGYIDEHLFPVASILDPTYTFTVSKYQTAAGTIDAINHVLEQYFCSKHTLLTDGMCEATIKSLMKNVVIALNEPTNYEARSELMLDCSLACNGILSLGNSSSNWPLHAIEHALSGFYDITHGVGLGIITPRWMKHILSEKTVDRLAQYGTNIFNIDKNLNKYEIANKSIELTYKFYKSLGIPMTLKEVNIDNTRLKEIAHHIFTCEHVNSGWVPLNEKDILDILNDSLEEMYD